jgi:hypothetical protein
VKAGIAILALLAICTIAEARPSKNTVETCVKTESTTPKVKYTAIPAHNFHDTEDIEAKRTETTIRHGKDEIGIWETSSPESFGLIYNGKQVSLDRVERLSSETPSRFNPSLAKWGVINEGSHSYICITFNFEGLGQSGSFQSVRGIYLVDRTARKFEPFYTVGRVTQQGVVLAK